MTENMSFAEALGKQMPLQMGAKCQTQQWLSGQTAEDVAEFNKALKSSMRSTDIHKAMRMLGFFGRVDNLQRHRREDCTCVIP
jgi:hypothetical protein